MSYEQARGLSHKILHEAIEEAKKTPLPEPISATARVIPSGISDLIDNSAHSADVKTLFRQLFTELLGVEKEIPSKVREQDTVRVGTGYKVGMVVVPLENPNDHNYEVGEPVLVIGLDHDEDAKALRSNGSIGNYLPSNDEDPDAVRLATDEEIKAFYDGLSGSGKSAILLVA